MKDEDTLRMFVGAKLFRRKMGLSPLEDVVLTLVRLEPGICMVQTSRRAELTPMQVTKMVRSLVGRRMLQVVPDPETRTRKLLYITETGLKYQRALLAAARRSPK